MMRNTFSAFALVAALGATAAVVPAAASAQDRDNHHVKEHRVYDRAHRDYHIWNADEDHAYREYLTQQHRKYRAFDRMSKKQQLAYWQWRHDHERR